MGNQIESTCCTNTISCVDQSIDQKLKQFQFNLSAEVGGQNSSDSMEFDKQQAGGYQELCKQLEAIKTTASTLATENRAVKTNSSQGQMLTEIHEISNSSDF